MARIDSSDDGLRGRKGNKIYYKVKGKTYAKEAEGKKKKPPSELQKFYFEKFRRVVEFLKPLKIPIEHGFQKYRLGMRTGMNVATGHALLKAVSGSMEDIRIDPGEILVSNGRVLGARQATMHWTSPGEVLVEWEDNSFEGNARQGDRVMIVLYDPIKGRSFYILEGAFRNEKMQAVKVFRGEAHLGSLHGYISFFQRSRKGEYHFSPSVYLGIV